jgi:hypothetical protein
MVMLAILILYFTRLQTALFKELKAQGQQRIQRRFVNGVGLVQAVANRGFEGGEVGVVSGVQTLFLYKFR